VCIHIYVMKDCPFCPAGTSAPTDVTPESLNSGVSAEVHCQPRLAKRTFLLQRLNTEKRNNRGTVRHGDLYSVGQS
jgi:hypothetical protein